MNNSNLEFRKIKSLKFMYEINENGTIFRNVKSKKQSKIKLDFHHSKVGYYYVFVHLGGRKHQKILRLPIAMLVAECWLGDKPDGLEIDHIDRNPHNNDYRNLRYVTKSEQMKNRDYSNISKQGAKNLQRARELRAVHTKLVFGTKEYTFASLSDTAKFLSDKYNRTYWAMRDRLTKRRSHIYDFDVFYFINAETKRDCSKEQEIVHNYDYDLTSDYHEAFNLGKQQEADMRVKHTGVSVD